MFNPGVKRWLPIADASDTLCSPLNSIASLVYDSSSDDSTAEGSKQLSKKVFWRARKKGAPPVADGCEVIHRAC